MSSSRGRRAGLVSAGADNSYRRDLNRDGEGKRAGSERRTRVPARVSKDFDNEVGRCVEDLWLIAEVSCREDETKQLGDLLNVGQPGRRFHLSQQV